MSFLIAILLSIIIAYQLEIMEIALDIHKKSCFLIGAAFFLI